MKIKLSLLFIFITVLSLSFLSRPHYSFAATASKDYQPLATITDPFGKPVDTTNFPAYLQSIYTIAIGAVFVMGVVIFIIAGFEKIGSESVFKKSDANSRMTSALIGLAIALGSYILLQTINPDLLKFNINIFQVGQNSPSTTPTPANQSASNSSDSVVGHSSFSLTPINSAK